MRFFRLLLTISVAVIATLATGCQSPDGGDTPQQEIAVTYYTINGAWQLTTWNGKELDAGTQLFIEFDRKEQRFEIWDNIGSMYMTQTTGGFTIEKNEYEEYILAGWYDYGVGDWASDYSVNMPQSGDSMTWRSTTTPETMTFTRIESIPEFNN